jgi:hypothetical protein
MILRVGLCPWPSAGVSGESEMFRDPLWEASDEVDMMGWHAHAACWRPSKGELARRSL